MIPRNLHDDTEISEEEEGEGAEEICFSGSEITTDRNIKCENKRGIWRNSKPYYICKNFI
jgi:hypothetical protein